MPPPPPGSPPRAATITRTPSGSGASRSPFTPRARKTALERLPVHLLSFEDLSDDEEGGGDVGAGQQHQQQQPPVTTSSASKAPAALSPKAATATALRTWKDDAAAAASSSASKGSGFTLSAEDLEFHSRIAEGAYGVVWRARLRPGWRRRGRRRSSAVVAAGGAPDGGQQQPAQQGGGELEEGKPQEVAVKVQRVPPGEEDEQGQANLLIELSVLQGLVHPRLVRYHGAALLPEAEARGRKEWRPLLVPPGQAGARRGGCLGAIQETCSPLLLGAEEAKESGEPQPPQPNDAAPPPPPLPAEAGPQEGEGGSASTPVLVLIAMEYCVRGSLRQALQSSAAAGQPLPWPLRVRLAADIAEGLAFLHEHGLLHRDLKTTNVVLDRGFRAKLCDHSFAAAAHSPDLAAFTCGTDEFLAPEAALGEPPGYDKPCDVFSLGVVLCELLTGREPGKAGFLCRTARDLFQLDPEEMEAAAPPECPASLRMLALHCAQNEPLDRPTAAEAQEWAASLLGELTGAGDGGEDGVALPPCASPLPWPLAPEPEEEPEPEAVIEKEEKEKGPEEAQPVVAAAAVAAASGKARKVSWAQVAMRGTDSPSSPNGAGGGSQQQAHGHKRALSASTSTAAGASSSSASSPASATPGSGGKRWAQDGEDGSRPLPPQQESLPGLLGSAGERSPHRNRGKGKGGRGGGRGGGGGSGQRGRRGGRGEGGHGSGSKSSPQKGSSPGQRPGGSAPQPEPLSPSQRIRGRGRVGSLDNSLSLSMSSSLAASAFARGRLGTPNCPLPSTFAAAVIGGAQGAGRSSVAKTSAGAMDALVQGVEGMRLASGAPRQPSAPTLPLHDKELPFAGQLAATGWERRMGQAQAHFQAQLAALRRELDVVEAAMGSSGMEEEEEEVRQRRLTVLRQVEALESVVTQEVGGAVAAVGEAVAAFRERVARG